MRKTTSALLALCALAALAGRADDPEPDPAKEELKKLQGTWTVTKWLSSDGEGRPSSEMTFTFDGDKLTQSTYLVTLKVKDDRTMKYKVKVGTKKRPHTITLTLTPSNRTRSQAGIYKIEKGVLYLTLGLPVRGGKGAVAPKDFSGDTGPVYVMTREKAKEKGKE
jgi:uncharacterized protein (TIGR03067 family)